jgi:hypothetical protein
MLRAGQIATELIACPNWNSTSEIEQRFTRQ